MTPRIHALLFVALLFAGCTPFGHKSEPSELFPEDSVSRRLAESVVPEPLVLSWRRDGGEGAYFGSIVIGPDTTICVGDLQRHSVRRYTLDGKELESLTGFSFPYLTGQLGDTIAVYDAGTNRLVSVENPDVGLDLPPQEGESISLSRQVALANGVVYLKDAHPPLATIRKLSQQGGREETFSLPGPSWHHFGVLRTWLGRIISSSSYRPVFYLLDPSGGGIDSLRLNGFDSPMLARMRAYELRKVDEPPLMISGVFGTEQRLYVINVRPGVLRIDLYDRKGRIERVLQWEQPEPTGFTPVDLVVLEKADSTQAYVASVNAVYGALSIQYASRLDRFTFPSAPKDG